MSGFFWPCAGLVLACLALGLPLAGEIATSLAIALILIGGLPHGGHDLALARRAFALGSLATTVFVGAYVAAAFAMLLLWAIAPLLALVAFLALSTLHFADDWRTSPHDRAGGADPMAALLRVATGFAVIAAASLGQREAVTALFVAMAGPDAVWIVRVAVAAAPVTLLVTAVAIWQTWRSGARQRAVAMMLALALLLVTPPLIGFALFFALLHAPRHMQGMEPLLGARGDSVRGNSVRGNGVGGNGVRDWRWASRAQGPLMALLAVALWWWVAPLVLSGAELLGPAMVFQLLSVVAVPHLVCSHHLALYLAQERAGRG